jgi:hypothetical protein
VPVPRIFGAEVRAVQQLRVLSVSIVIAGLAGAAYAQGGTRGGGNYNPATETTVNGTVEAVATVASPGAGGGGLHLTVAVPTGAIEVEVGPASFVAAKNVTFVKGDAVTVVGSKVTVSSRDVIIAREIKKGDQVLTLRDAKGFPLWAGRGRGQ